ncbi:uncharacterized protein LOC126888346 [Diabrotica virgifera virgifera]|uniref:Tyr recombinase domain-containing protein n=1 Tax=Diabrotica virgifera virgifera TaxID=50390 RepID=A0ABM5KQK8_DIAVI|nr:uncharacterized protein LOC126888346 [Diabrotica virgifera virgifera]
MIKVALIFGVAGALRKDELLKLETNNVQYLESKFLVTIKASKTHTNRIFTIADNEANTILNEIKKYISLRPAHTPHKRFFIFYKNKCSTQPVDINTFSKIPFVIAKFLKLEHPHLYTGHCFRRSSGSILCDSGADFSAIKRLGGWKSTAVAEGYIDNSMQNKLETAEKLLGQNTTKPCQSTSFSTTASSSITEFTEVQEDLNIKSKCYTADNHLSKPSFNFSNCIISNISVYNNKTTTKEN